MALIPLANIDLSDLERRYVCEALDARELSGTASFIPRFEAALAECIGRKHVIACSNGTLALLAALMALGVSAGDEVIVSALTFAAPAAMVRVLGAIPVFVDIREDNWTLNWREARRKITWRTKAVIAVDLAGHPCDYDDADTDGIPVIEDAAEAIGSAAYGKPVGSFGTISTFSFFANKSIVCGEGGAVCTDDDALAERLRMIVNHGMPKAKGYVHPIVGLNARMPNLCAAVGLGQVERWTELFSKRECLHQWYQELLPAGYKLRPVSPWATYIPWMETVTGNSVERVIRVLRDAGIDSRTMFPVMNSHPPYRDGQRYPTAGWVSKSAFFLPTSSMMSKSDVECVVENLP